MDRGSHPAEELAPSKRNLALRDAIDKFIKHQTNLHCFKAARHYRFILNQFAGVCTKQYVQQVEKQDLYDFAAWLREHGAADRTVHNKVGDTICMLRFHEINRGIRWDVRKGNSGRWPGYFLTETQGQQWLLGYLIGVRANWLDQLKKYDQAITELEATLAGATND